ncbi:hypothetical protein C8J23_12015 [Shewanella chilikensis]|uniref:Uncharacterized protein n=1 Tax=Shewanella chilikensis TaxID=558541 RepID=A0ABX5PLX2_9GAMM|nr:hypothetical protein [Shewanella chilikensis]MCL1152582.1 hypothetical protein [Shewanella chilikensis]PYE57565.1 hypothetical protein C8J23_12015 [Shewanella chilikensis]GGZ46344.1 hypothetical protein GCM10007105_35800 [Shewanella chilikensis]
MSKAHRNKHHNGNRKPLLNLVTVAPKLTKADTQLSTEQASLLAWLALGRSVDVCTELCPDLGKVAEMPDYPGHFNKRSLFALKREGLTQEQDCYFVGMRWCRVSLSPKGQRLAALITERALLKSDSLTGADYA